MLESTFVSGEDPESARMAMTILSLEAARLVT